MPSTISEVYAGLAGSDLLETIADTVVKMFTRIADETVKPAPCSDDPSRAKGFDFTVHQEFRGGFAGVLALNMTVDLLQRIAGKMLGEEVKDPGEEAQDGAAEFLNIVSGNICAKLSAFGKSADIAPPKVHDNRGGTKIDLAGVAAGGRVVVTPLLHPESGVELVVVERGTGA